jgi:hypothetical protein
MRVRAVLVKEPSGSIFDLEGFAPTSR